MKRLMVVSVLFLAAVAVAEAKVLQFPSADYPDLRTALGAAAGGDTLEQIEAGDFSDGEPIPARGLSFIGLGPERCTIHFTYASGAYVMSLGDYPGETEFRGFTITGDEHGKDFSWLYAVSVDGSTLRISNVVVDCWGVGICATSDGSGTDVDGQVFIDHATFTGADPGLLVNGGDVHFQNSVMSHCDPGIAFAMRWGATLDNHDNLFEACNPTYYEDATAGPGEFDGVANLNSCFVPQPRSDAIIDGPDLGAIDWTPLDFRLELTGGVATEQGVRFTPGDEFLLTAVTDNANCGDEGIEGDLYVILAAYGEYYFWPSWTTAMGSAPRVIAEGSSQEIILQFVWPTGAGTGNAAVYGMLLAPGSVAEEGARSSLGMAAFSWSE